MSEPSTNKASEEFRVLGVDLAAQPNKTACCEITCTVTSSGQLVSVKPILYGPKTGKRYADDCALLKEFNSPDPSAPDPSAVARIGIDSPFGWPIGFVNALSHYSCRNRWPDNDPDVYAGPNGSSSREYRDLKFRATDLVLWEKGIRPLSVAVNTLGSVAIRNASLLSRAGAEGLSVDRSGRTGRFVEVYPGAAFAQWGIDMTGYKKKKEDGVDARMEVLKELEAKACVFSLEDDVRRALSQTDHCVDAFVSAIVALMVELDRRIDLKREKLNRLTCPIPPGMEALAKMEGWIALPKEESLEQLEARLGLLRTKE